MSSDRLRSIRIPDDLWTAAQEVASARRETVSDVVRRALFGYVTIFSASEITDRAHTAHRSRPSDGAVSADA